MGAECIISGIRPQIAQTIVHLGVDLGTILTKASLADAFQVALSKTGRVVRKANAVGVVNLRSAAAPLTGASAGANARL
jgi:rsbT co-antagonist protein RsbR